MKRKARGKLHGHIQQHQICQTGVGLNVFLYLGKTRNVAVCFLLSIRGRDLRVKTYKLESLKNGPSRFYGKTESFSFFGKMVQRKLQTMPQAHRMSRATVFHRTRRTRAMADRRDRSGFYELSWSSQQRRRTDWRRRASQLAEQR